MPPRRQADQARSAGSRPRGRLRAGFTLLELLIVLAVIAVVASIAVPAFFERSEVTLDSACRLLAEDLRAAQNRAVYLRAEVRVQFRTDGDGYAVVDVEGRALPAPGGDVDFVRRYSRDAVFEGVRITQVDCGPGLAIVYDERGRAELGGRAVVSYGNDSRLVEVARDTGAIRIPGLARPFVDAGY